MKSDWYFVPLMILLTVFVLFLDIFAIIHGDRGTILYSGLIGLALGLFGWAGSGFRIKDFFPNIGLGLALACVIISITGFRALVSPNYRARVLAEREAEEARILQRADDESNIMELIPRIDLPDAYENDKRSGTVIIAFHDANGIQLSNSQDWVKESQPPIVVDRLSDAQTLMWIERVSTIVGAYHMKVVGDVSAQKTGNALKITWKVWLIDLQSSEVIAQEVFVGPNPPQETEQTGDYGISPKNAVLDWLYDLPNQKSVN